MNAELTSWIVEHAPDDVALSLAHDITTSRRERLGARATRDLLVGADESRRAWVAARVDDESVAQELAESDSDDVRAALAGNRWMSAAWLSEWRNHEATTGRVDHLIARNLAQRPDGDYQSGDEAGLGEYPGAKEIAEILALRRDSDSADVVEWAGAWALRGSNVHLPALSDALASLEDELVSLERIQGMMRGAGTISREALTHVFSGLGEQLWERMIRNSGPRTSGAIEVDDVGVSISKE